MANSDWDRNRNYVNDPESDLDTWRANPIISRLDCWADNLPISDPIPIGADEVYEICALMVGKAVRYGVTGKPSRNMSETEILDSLRGGNFHYREHKLVII